MFHVIFITFIDTAKLPYVAPYLPIFHADTDSANDSTALNIIPSPNTVIWEASISAATLDTWLSDVNIYIISYDEVANEPI